MVTNSKIIKGQYFKDQTGSKNIKKVNVYRWNPDDGKNPRVDVTINCKNVGNGSRSVVFDEVDGFKGNLKAKYNSSNKFSHFFIKLQFMFSAISSILMSNAVFSEK